MFGIIWPLFEKLAKVRRITHSLHQYELFADFINLTQIWEYEVGARSRLVIFDTVSAYCGSFFSFVQVGCLRKSAKCSLCASWVSADNIYVKCGRSRPINAWP